MNPRVRLAALIVAVVIVNLLIWFSLHCWRKRAESAEVRPDSAHEVRRPETNAFPRVSKPKPPPRGSEVEFTATDRAAAHPEPEPPAEAPKTNVSAPTRPPAHETQRVAKGTSTIQGIVTVMGRPPKRLFVELDVFTKSGKEVHVPVKMEDRGRYRAENVPAGIAEVFVDATPVEGPRRSRFETLAVGSNRRHYLDVDFGESCVITGTLLGLRENEAGYVLALPGEYNIEAQSIDDVEALAAAAAAEIAVPRPRDGSAATYRLDGLEPGAYTVIALADGRFSGQTAEEGAMWFVSRIVHVQAGETASADLDLE